MRLLRSAEKLETNFVGLKPVISVTCHYVQLRKSLQHATEQKMY